MAAARQEQDGLQPELRYMDWMFSPQSVWCAGGIEKDLSTYSIEFRVFVCVFALLALIWPLYLHKKRGDELTPRPSATSLFGNVSPNCQKRTAFPSAVSASSHSFIRGFVALHGRHFAV